MTTRVPSAPTSNPIYDPKWMYWFWDWVRQNRAGYAGTGVIFTGDVLGTLNAGTSALSLSTTGVAAGTYGGKGTFAQLGVDAKGRITAGTRWDLGAVAPILNTSGTLSHATSGVTAGTYGTGGTMVPQVTVDAQGHVTAVSDVGIAFPASSGGTSTATFTGAVLGTGTFPGGPTGFTFIPNPSFTGTGTFAGVVSTGAGGVLRGGQGNSGSLGRAPVSMAPIVGSTRSNQAIFTFAAATAPLNAITGTGNGVDFSVWGTWGNTPSRFGIVVGSGTVVASFLQAVVPWAASIEVYSLSDTTQTYLARFDMGGGTSGRFEIVTGTFALATGSAIAIQVVGTQATNVNTMVCYGGRVNFRNSQ